MDRRTLLLALSTAMFLGERAKADGTNAADVVRIDLKQRLEKGLRAARPSEFAFISYVVGLVEAGKLPQGIVDRAFLYARGKPEHQVVYFQRVLKALAAKLGYTV